MSFINNDTYRNQLKEHMTSSNGITTQAVREKKVADILQSPVHF